MLKGLISQTRTFRRFDNSHKISLEQLEILIKLAQLSGSARNCQPWQYILVTEEKKCSEIFPHLFWAGYLKEWHGPDEEERPSAYILCILNNSWLKGSTKEANFDLGIASQNILLGATENGLGGCRIASFKPDLASHFHLEKDQGLELVIAIGKPKEKVKIIDGLQNESVAYWRDENNLHHVPKRSLDDIIIR